MRPNPDRELEDTRQELIPVSFGCARVGSTQKQQTALVKLEALEFFWGGF